MRSDPPDRPTSSAGAAGEPSFAVRLPADPAATFALGRALGERLVPGQTLALTGPLGAGKTTLVRGLAHGLGTADPDAVASPTYLLVVEHDGRKPLVHADAYLPAKLQGFLAEGGLDYLLDRRAVVAVEWADRIRDLLPADALWLDLAPALDGGRVATFTAAAGGLAGRLPEWLPALVTGFLPPASPC